MQMSAQPGNRGVCIGANELELDVSVEQIEALARN